MSPSSIAGCPTAPALPWSGLPWDALCHPLDADPPLSPTPARTDGCPAYLGDILQRISRLQQILSRLLSPAGDLSQCREILGIPSPPGTWGRGPRGSWGWVGAAAPPYPAPSLQPCRHSCVAQVSQIYQISAPRRRVHQPTVPAVPGQWEVGGQEATVRGCPGSTTGLAGHAEMVRVILHLQKLSCKELPKVLWENHDPTQGRDKPPGPAVAMGPAAALGQPRSPSLRGV